MTNAELIAKIKAEIERLKDENRKIKCQENERYCSGYDDAFYDLVPFLNALELEKSVPNDLEEVAVDIADNLLAKPKDYVLAAKADYWNGVHDGVVAGAKWQAEQDKETVELAEDHAYLAGAINEREKMLKGAVEGEVYKFGEVAYVKERNNAELTKYLSRFNNGDKVKIIVIHETDIR